MDILKKTIDLLEKEEIINYKLYANRTQSNEKRKDIQLFDLVKKQLHEYDDTKISEKLYPNSKNKSNYYRLKNRLLHEINNSLVQFYCFDNNSHDIYSELSLYKVFLKKNNWQLANYHLQKAERKALVIQDFSLLDVIYNEQINLSIKFGETAPNTIIEKREQNREKLNITRDLDDSLANLIYDLKRTQNFSKANNQTAQILKNVLLHLNSKKEFKDNLTFKIKSFNAISRLLLSKQDYSSLEKYTIETYNEFYKNNYFSKVIHETKLQMLAYISNTLFVNKKHTESLGYLKLLHNSMKEFKSMHYNNYVFFYYNSLVNNYNVINPDKAIEVLNEAKEDKAIISHPTHLGYVYLNLAGTYFDLKQHKIALKNIIKLYNHKLFDTIDNGFKMKIQITEIILRIETIDYEYAYKLLNTIYKTYKVLFTKKEYKQDADFIQLLKELIWKHDMEKNKYSLALIKSFNNKNHINNSLSIVNYKAWLSEKFKLTE